VKNGHPVVFGDGRLPLQQGQVAAQRRQRRAQFV
jgi:hypothetical protein